jgi:HAD superfamily hydrolase (TIGR01509 family)
MSFECFIFDFDGTLARSEHAYLHSFKHSIKLHTGVEVSEDEFRKYWHMNFTPEDILKEYGEEMLEEMVVSFEEYYYQNHLHHLDVYEGISELLIHLQQRQTKLGLVSLKPRRAGVRELETMALDEIFRVQIWGDDVENVKPAPDGVHQALGALNVQPEQTLVIGDSAADILMGRAAGTLTAAAMWGNPKREKLLAAAPDFVIDSPADLLKLF